jgi:hypothetical protein
VNGKIIDCLLTEHKLTCRRHLAASLPVLIILAPARIVTTLPAALAHLFMSGLNWLLGKIGSTSKVSTIFGIAILPMVGVFLLFILVDTFVSEALMRRVYSVMRVIHNYEAKDVRAVLARKEGFVLYLRDFDPSDSEIFAYRPLVGATVTYAHRDRYIFAGVLRDDETRLPIISVASLKEGPPTNKSFCYLMFRQNAWEKFIRQLMAEAVGIIVVVPSSGHLGQLTSSRDLDSANRSVSEFFRLIEFEPRGRGVAREVRWILEQDALLAKTLVASGFMDGSPGVTSDWISFKDFRKIETDEAQQTLMKWCSPPPTR